MRSFGFLLLILLMVSNEATADRNKRAKKALEEGDYDKAESLLLKSLEKDPINPGAKYLYSVLFIEKAFNRYSIDSSHHFIVAALKDYARGDEDILDQLEKNEISLKAINEQKERIDSLAFQRSLEVSTISGYQEFIDEFEGAAQINKAIAKRDSLAFLEASQKNRWQSYKRFMETYPISNQYDKAKKRYQKLIYEEKTKDKKLSSYKNFLVEFPDTPYRNQIELKIFRISTASGRKNDLLDFLVEYPKSSVAEKAIGIMHHLFPGEKLPAFYDGFLPVVDSIKNLEENIPRCLYPIYQEDEYTFYDDGDNAFLSGSYEHIPDAYKCGKVDQDYLMVANSGVNYLVNLKGKVFFKGDFDDAHDLGSGVIVIKKDNSMRAIHKTGFEITANGYEKIEFLNNILKVCSNNRCGLMAINGRRIFEQRFDDICVLNGFWVFESYGQLAVSTIEEFIKAANGEEVSLDFRYDEVELINNKYLIAFRGEHETLISNELEIIIPEDKQFIEPVSTGWLVKKDDGYRLFTREGAPYNDKLLQNVEVNKNWLAMYEGQGWQLIALFGSNTARIDCDSIKLISDPFIFYTKEDKEYIQFIDRLVQVENKSKVTLVKDFQEVYKEEFLAVSEGKNIELYDAQGNLLFDINASKIEFLTDTLFRVTYQNKKGIVNKSGQWVLKNSYDAIGELNNDLVLIIYKGKFGAYDFRKELLIQPSFENRLEKFNDTLLIAEKDFKKGIVDLQGNPVIDFQFKAIDFWNDTSILVKEEIEWFIINTKNGNTYYDGILNYEELYQNNDEKIIRFKGEEGFGILSNARGEILEPTYQYIANVNCLSPTYLAVKYIKEANYYFVIYLDNEGNIFKRLPYTAAQYQDISCEMVQLKDGLTD